jgi:hypothetical protein
VNGRKTIAAENGQENNKLINYVENPGARRRIKVFYAIK